MGEQSLETSNRRVRWIVLLGIIVSFVAGSAARGQEAPQARIVNQIKNEERVAVQGSTPALVKRSVDAGRLNGGQNLGRMVLLLSATPEQEQAAAELVASQHDASSPLYHKWLTPAQYGAQFGVANEDAQKVQQWLQTQGLTVHEVSQSRLFVVFSGSVSQVEQAFSTEMHSYSFGDKKFIANATDVQLPAALSSVVRGVVRLHSDPHAPALKIGGKIKVNRKTGKIEGGMGLHFLGPADFATIYHVQPLYDAGINGAGQAIAIVTRSSLVDPVYGIDGVQDIRDFRNAMGLPANDPEVIVNGDDPGVFSYDDTLEAMLDVTWAGAVAPMAHVIAVASQSNFADGVDVSAAYIVDHNLATIMSTSFGTCEQNIGPTQNAYYNALWQQAAAQGITSFVSAGDNGGAGCDNQASGLFASNGVAVNGLASTPYNVAVGGTQFDDVANPDSYWLVDGDPTTLRSAISYIPEKVWNESSADPSSVSLWAGSGGVSTIYSKPNWQTATGVPNDGKRDLPDISLAAASHTGYAICFGGSCSSPDYISVYPVGGTSASSPAAAGVMALVLQKLNGQPQGLANFVFYKLAATPGVYHDITQGDNKVPDENGQNTVGYSAGPGYDLATGLGSLDVTALVNHWSAASATGGSTTTIALKNGQATTVVHGSPVAFNVKVTCSGNNCAAPTGDVALQASSDSGDFAGVGAVHLTPGKPTSSASVTSTTIPGGTYGVSARYTGDGKYYSSTSNPINITVTPEATQMDIGGVVGGYASTSALSVSYGEPIPFYVAVAGKSGQGYPSGQVSLQLDGQTPYVVTIDYKTLSSLTLNHGEHSSYFSNGGKDGSESSIFAYISSPPGSDANAFPLGIPAGIHQLQANYPGDNSFARTQGSYQFTVTKSDTLITDVFFEGTAVVNVPVTVAGQIVLANNSCANYGGTVTLTEYSSTNPSSGKVIASGQASTDYCDSFFLPVTFTTPGNHLVRVNFSGDSNTKASSSTGTLVVNANTSAYVNLSTDVSSTSVGSPVTITAQVASDVRQYTATGSVTFVDGAATLGTVKLDAMGTATLVVSSLAPGTHNLSANYAGDAVLQAASGGPAVVSVADYAIQLQPASLTIPAGQAGTATLNILPIGGFAQSVQLSCGSVPANLSCSFSPATVTLDGANVAAVKVTVSTRTTAAMVSPGRAVGAIGTIAFAALLLPFGRRRRLKMLLGTMGILVVVFCGVGCGSSAGSSSGNNATTKAGIYAVSVTATSSGTTAKSTSLVVTVTN
jgi:Pro-kumamolisin, activation domain/Bacterial Ig-like domain (group 3)